MAFAGGVTMSHSIGQAGKGHRLLLEIWIREIDLLPALIGHEHIGDDDVDLAAYQCRDQRAEIVVQQPQLHADVGGESPGYLDVEARQVTVLHGSEGKASARNADDERAVRTR